jgi:hypothetical protein
MRVPTLHGKHLRANEASERFTDERPVAVSRVFLLQIF